MEESRNKSDDAYRTIGEVSELINVPQHIIRFWETKFDQISPTKNKGRRYYNKSDIELLKEIRDLLQEKGFTIKGVSQFFNEQNVQNNQNTEIETESEMENKETSEIKENDNLTIKLIELRNKLEKLRDKL